MIDGECRFLFSALTGFPLGVVAGLRSMTAPAAVSWAARTGRLRLDDTLLEFVGYAATSCVVGLLAAGELVVDKLPTIPSRKKPLTFCIRLVAGAISGAAAGKSRGSMAGGLAGGLAGAVAGTLGGYECRVRGAKAVGRDLPVALMEDAIAIGVAALVVLGGLRPAANVTAGSQVSLSA
jgi:uncharacterized membrane protein